MTKNRKKRMKTVIELLSGTSEFSPLDFDEYEYEGAEVALAEIDGELVHIMVREDGALVADSNEWRMIYTIENFIKGVAQVMRSEEFLESLAQAKKESEKQRQRQNDIEDFEDKQRAMLNSCTGFLGKEKDE